MRITVLSGGVGGARFTRGLLALLRDRHPDGHGGTTAEVTVVANSGDDMWLHGVRVCPDLDTLMYTLGGAVHEEQGWGRRDETSRVSADLAAYDVGWDWFTLGDLDLATHLARTQWLREGLTLTEATERLARRWDLAGQGVRLLPMSDQPVETHVVVADAEGGGERLIHFEEWWVRHRAALPALRFEQVGLAASTPAPGVLDALTSADVVVLPPSNPVVSVSTILAVPGVRETLAASPAPVVGVSPIVGGAAVRGMAAQCLATVGVDATAEAVARYLGRRGPDGTPGLDGPGVLDAWLVDDVDTDAAAALRADGWRASAAPTLMHDVPTTARIAAAALALVGA
ncbi:2-phospho-L-lactate transferase [Cellulomonas triticagri]|uniref:2-phospho-L-lactate transferase n=1 Tax=Cellulomonas triticagri TaxID=2483352 RepID=A0A3M2JB24_9CELL|nr:2-phospho-L-lactate transferase [Cellulomonas triticagri]RMI09406.1 2-phospho-L-lactate transferase [Cellulomonas triticagri]